MLRKCQKNSDKVINEKIALLRNKKIIITNDEELDQIMPLLKYKNKQDSLLSVHNHKRLGLLDQYIAILLTDKEF